MIGISLVVKITSDFCLIGLIADIPLAPTDLPFCSVIQKQTGSSRLHVRHQSDSGGCQKADITR